jgi:WD40 repeat protein
VLIWDQASGQERTVLESHSEAVTAVAIAPDGAWLATVGVGGSVRIWDSATGGICAVMRVDSRLEDCAWNPSGQCLVAAGDAGLFHFTFKP